MRWYNLFSFCFILVLVVYLFSPKNGTKGEYSPTEINSSKPNLIVRVPNSESSSSLKTQETPAETSSFVNATTSKDQATSKDTQNRKITGLITKLDTKRRDYGFARSLIHNFQNEALQVRLPSSVANASSTSTKDYVSGTDTIPAGFRLAGIFVRECLVNDRGGTTSTIRRSINWKQIESRTGSIVALGFELTDATEAEALEIEIQQDPCLAGVTENIEFKI